MNGEGGSPWFHPGDVPGQREPQDQPEPQEWQGYDEYSLAYQQDWYGQQAYTQPQPQPSPQTQSQQQPYPQPEPYPQHQAPAQAPLQARHRHRPESVQESAYAAPFVPAPAPAPDDDETVGLPTSDTGAATPEQPTGGRAERRRAAKGRGKRRAAAPTPPKPSEGGAPLSRVEARRAARAAKDSPAVIASRAFGELFITIGVLMLLFVTYQLWWTNILAGQQANAAADQIQDDWAQGRAPGAFEPGRGFAIMHIPKLDVVVPIAEGTDKHRVLDRGMVGHYADGALKTAMPEDKQGNFAVAGHRNTHGEPFRYINRLEPGDPIVVETQDRYYTYEMASILPQTAPSNVGVIAPVPAGAGFTGPGRYITLTTCTPEFTSTYRMIVWGKMVEERPRSKGKPDALVG
ncbi:class E sortase [Streptomyces sp. NPDC006678]|uniref:class E sortase n=1 Tax=Streptomyces sp. NPDC006678 TaxID=3157185 RepID=UPI0033C7885C